MRGTLRVWLSRFPGAPWSAAALAVVAALPAVVLAGVGHGVLLHAVGWPLVVALLLLHAVAVTSEQAAQAQHAGQAEQTRRAPRSAATRVGFFAYCFGAFPLLTTLIFGPQPFAPDGAPDLGAAPDLAITAGSGAFFAAFMLIAFELMSYFGRRWGPTTRQPETSS